MVAPRPVRLQRKRARGFDLQAASRAINGLPAKSVTRPGPFGSPFIVGMFDGYAAADAVRDYEHWLSQEPCCRSFELAFGLPPQRGALAHLRGHNLACFCRLCDRHAATGKPLDEDCPECAPCHVDPLGKRVLAMKCEDV
jgi:hypothetical protein